MNFSMADIYPNWNSTDTTESTVASEETQNIMGDDTEIKTDENVGFKGILGTLIILIALVAFLGG